MGRLDRVIDLGGDDAPPPAGLPLSLCASAADTLAKQVRWLYIHCYRDYTGKADYGTAPMPKWDGGLDEYDTRSAAIWPRIVNKIILLGAEPFDYIRAQFYGRKNARPPWPNMLLGDAAAATWREFVGGKQVADDVRRALECEGRSIRAIVLSYTAGPKWPYDKALRYALGDTVQVRASALTRYCIATAHGQNDFVEYFHEQALLQFLLRQREYEDSYGELIPEKLRHEAAELRAWLGLTR